MKSLFSYAVALILALGVAAGVSAADKKDKPKKTPAEVFKAHDKNSDGKLSLDEFVGKKKDQAKEKAEATFKQKDKNNDGFLSVEEFTAAGKKKKDAK